MLVVYEILKKV